MKFLVKRPYLTTRDGRPLRSERRAREAAAGPCGGLGWRPRDGGTAERGGSNEYPLDGAAAGGAGGREARGTGEAVVQAQDDAEAEAAEENRARPHRRGARAAVVGRDGVRVADEDVLCFWVERLLRDTGRCPAAAIAAAAKALTTLPPLPPPPQGPSAAAVRILKLNEKQLRHIKHAFDKIDVDGGGKISNTEFFDIMG